MIVDAEELKAVLDAKARSAATDLTDARLVHSAAEEELADTQYTATMAAWADPAFKTIIETLEEPDKLIVAAAAEVLAAVEERIRAVGAATDMAVRHMAIQAQGGAGEVYNQDTGPSTGAATTAEPAPEPTKTEPSKTVKDPVKVGTKMDLGDGETFAGSAKTRSDQAGAMVLVAAVDTPDGRVLHVGVVHEESKGDWRGGNAPAQEEKVEGFEDGGDPADYNLSPEEVEDMTYTVDTGADTTVVIPADAAAQLPEQVDEIIAKAKEVDQEYKATTRQYDKLDREREKIEGKRFADPADVERKKHLDHRMDHSTKYQKWRRDQMRKVRAKLSPEDQARYDELQEQIDRAGVDIFEADKEAEAAAVCDLSVDQLRELQELKRIPYTKRTRAQHARVDFLGGDGAYRPDLLTQQAALVRGLTFDEYVELGRLRAIGDPKSLVKGGRNEQQEARYQQLVNAPGGATEATPEKTRKTRNGFENTQATHHDTKLEWAREKAEREELMSRAGPLNEKDAARLEQVNAELAVLGDRIDTLTDTKTAVEIPGKDGKTLIVAAHQQEEYGGVDYVVDVRPADADEDWYSGSVTEPYRTDDRGLQKVAGQLSALSGEK